MAHEFGAHQLSLHRSLVTPKLVSLATDANMPVTIWTADDPEWVKRAANTESGHLLRTILPGCWASAIRKLKSRLSQHALP